MQVVHKQNKLAIIHEQTSIEEGLGGSLKSHLLTY
jgi:hypothetical protein